MSSKLLQRCLLWVVLVTVGLSISLFPDLSRPTLSATATTDSIAIFESAEELEARGKYFYSIAQFQRAVELWQKVIQVYSKEDALTRARVMSNLALAYSQLGDRARATTKIAESLALLESEVKESSGEGVRVLARVLNNQGIIQLSQGEPEQAIATWKQAKINYELANDELGSIRASINQASAFKQLGLYRRALKSLQEIEERLIQLPDSSIKIAGLRSYGEILRLVGQQERSRELLEQSLTVASGLELPLERVRILLILGSTYKTSDRDRALELYDRSLTICQQSSGCLSSDLPVQIYLAQLNLLSNGDNWQPTIALIPKIQTEFARLPAVRDNIDRRINFAYSLLELGARPSIQTEDPLKILNRDKIAEFLEDTRQQARAIDYPQAQSYSLGLQGRIYEELGNWDEAKQYTERALLLAQSQNAAEIAYLWQWQLGRIQRALENRPQAIAHYSRAVELLKSLSQDLVAVDPDLQYSFRDSVEPVYRQLVSLLLDEGDKIPQANLEGAREVMESLQLAELNNFFREACLDARAVKIDNVDRQAAVIYPIILSDRLEVILSLPDRPLQHYTANIPQEELEAVIGQFRHDLVIRSRRNFYRPARRLYDLVIRPALEDLTRSQIDTIVFVPDGAFRNIPFGALHDGKHYLIEDYSIALTPGLQLLDPRPLREEKLKTVAAGLSEAIWGFSPLNYVDFELTEIKEAVDSVVLLNREFTTDTLYEKIKSSNYPVVHIATHGQFSSSIEDTFLLAWKERIDIDELDRILQTRPGGENPIELLVLSACETATGDERAALGLAGMAVRAGARSTLATFWAVNDRATAKLMSNFYHGLSDKNLPKAEAVRQAQLSLLKDPIYRHPFYWAAYVLLGNWL